MGQIDRNNLGNIMVKKEKSSGLFDLSPIIDFGSSYITNPPYPEFYFYDNPFIIIRKNKLSIAPLIKRYPQILKTINVLTTKKIEYVLNQIEKEKRIMLSDEELNYYEKKDIEYSKVLQKFI